MTAADVRALGFGSLALLVAAGAYKRATDPDNAPCYLVTLLAAFALVALWVTR